MQNLKRLHLLDVLNQKVLIDKTPILGICVGMQLMAQSSEEGQENGLGWFSGKVRRFAFDKKEPNLRVPCIGWNYVKVQRDNFLVHEGLQKFYFVHSYHYVSKSQDDILLSSKYGYEYTVGIHRENIYGVQFHPEKSHQYGLKLFQNFLLL